MFFKLSPILDVYGMTIWHLAGYFVLGVCFFSLCWCFLNIFLTAHFGYLQCPSTCSRGCSSSSASSGDEQMVRALYERVLITLYLAAILCLLSHGRYKSVWVSDMTCFLLLCITYSMEVMLHLSYGYDMDIYI